MKLHNAFAAGIAHLSQNRLRTGLSILGILIGIASVLCMMAIGDGAKELVALDIEKLGGANQVQFWTRWAIFRKSRVVRRTTERYTLADAYAIEAECPDVLFVLPKNDRYRGVVTSPTGGHARPYVEGVTADYAPGLHWGVQQGRFFSEEDIETAAQACILGADIVTELFGDTAALGRAVKIKVRWRLPPVRCRIIGIMAPKGRSLRRSTSLDDIVCVPLTTQ